MSIASGEKRPRPNFIGIGPGKAGTTWLYRVLDEHPEIGLASAKETLYFTTEFSRGEEWYLRLFRGCSNCKAIGEVSNTYIFNADVPPRIHRFDPRMKLISCLRNPVDRAFSHYLFLLRNGQVEGTFETVIDAMPDLLAKGQYAKHLAAYLDTFEERQMLVLLFDDLRRDPGFVARSVYDFLNVDPLFEAPTLHRKVLGASQPRSRAVAGLVKRAAIGIRAMGRPEIVHRVKESRFARALYRPLGAMDYPKMNAETRRRLEGIFRADVERLSGILDRDMCALWFPSSSGGPQGLQVGSADSI